MSVTVRIIQPDNIQGHMDVVLDTGAYTDIGVGDHLRVFDENDVEIAVYHRDRWVFAHVKITGGNR